MEKVALYLVPCSDCNFVYIGQLKQNLRSRLVEHMFAIKNQELKKFVYDQSTFHFYDVKERIRVAAKVRLLLVIRLAVRFCTILLANILMELVHLIDLSSSRVLQTEVHCSKRLTSKAWCIYFYPHVLN